MHCETKLKRKEALFELSKRDRFDMVYLTIYQKGLIVCFKLYIFAGIKLIQMLPNNSTFYEITDVKEDSPLAQ